MKRFVATARRAVAPATELVGIEPLADGQRMPLLIRPRVEGVDLFDWLARNRRAVEALRHEAGAVLLRGFGVDGADAFHRVIDLTSSGALEYRERSSPRHEVGQNIYTSTDHPADQSIFQHNEHSYAAEFPLSIYFACVCPAVTGGETPIADTRRIYQRIDPQVRETFGRRGYVYIRNFGDGFGLPWQTAFGTDERAVVEGYCAAHAIAVEWKAGDRLRTRQERRLFATHPSTGEAVWFNHATFFHVSLLPDQVREALLASFALDDLPNHTRYADDAEIEPEVISHLRAAYLAEQVEFAWEQGDVLLLDNMLASHGRNPYTGARRVLVGMADPFRWCDLH